MKLLLHICCGPCLIYPLKSLREKGFEVEGLFFNPNIHPYSEYKNRLQTVKDFTLSNNLRLNIPEYNIKIFFNTINNQEEKPLRCSLCWDLRLKETARFAKDNNFNYFSTTLLVSPYQDQNLLRDIGYKVEKESNIKFLYEDFRHGFRQAHNEAKESGMYCQKYCGCLYSEKERYCKC